MIYKVVKQTLQQHSCGINRTDSQLMYSDDGQTGSLEIWHKPTTLETVFEVKLLSIRFIIYAQNAVELAESVRYVRELGFNLPGDAS